MEHLQIVVLFAIISVVYGGYAKHQPYDQHPKYNYAYKVHDSYTGDVKSHEESRNGDLVKGSYSLIQPDGSKRTVHYTADDYNGFNAVVHTETYHKRKHFVVPSVIRHYYKRPNKVETSHVYALYHH